MNVYRIRRKSNGDYFTGNKGQQFFLEPGHAKASFNYVVTRLSGSWLHVKNKFDDQDAWEMVEYELIEKKPVDTSH